MKATKLTVSIPFILLVLLAFSTGLTAAISLFLVTSEKKLIASDAAALDSLGFSSALNGDSIIAGAPLQDQGGINAGAAYIFRRSGTGWTQEAKLTANDAAEGDQFGSSVGLDGDTAIVGSRLNDTISLNEGAAYIFRRTGTAWAQEAKLTANDAAAADLFGSSVSVDGNTAVAGAPGDDDGGSQAGSAYVFRWNGTAWVQEAKLTASDRSAGDQFGDMLSIKGNTVVIGAPFDDAGATDSGSAYVFRWNGTAWVQEAKLTAGDAAEGDQFGSSVSAGGDTVVIGSPFNDGAATDSGSAYVFRRDETTWVQEAKLTASDGVLGDRLGSSVTIKGDFIAAGALGDDNGTPNSGRVFLFQRTGATWGGETKLAASDATAGDQFGSSVSLEESTLAVAAVGDDDGGLEAGAIYVLEIATTTNQPPTADAGGPYAVAEGGAGAGAVVASGSDPEGSPLTFAWDLDNDGTFETPGQNPAFSAAGRDGPEIQPVVLQVCDDDGGCGAAGTAVNIANVAPEVAPIAGPIDPPETNMPESFSAGFTDAGLLDTHEALWSWGDGSQCDTRADVECEVNQGSGSGTAAGTHTYEMPGVYTVTVTVEDDDGGSGQASAQVIVIERAIFLVIDEDSIDNGNPPNFFSDTAVNDHIADIGVRSQLPFFGANVGSTITLHAGEVGDEGWFALTSIPDSWDAAGPTNDGVQNFVQAGPGLGSSDANVDREALLDEIPGVTPLRAESLALLLGRNVCGVVFDSDISINFYDANGFPTDGSLKGVTLGTVAFKVSSVTQLTGFSSSSLPEVNIEILNADDVCGGPLALFTDAPDVVSSSEPFDVVPNGEG